MDSYVTEDNVRGFLDPRLLRDSIDIDEVKTMLSIAAHCISSPLSLRPSASQVAETLIQKIPSLSFLGCSKRVLDYRGVKLTIAVYTITMDSIWEYESSRFLLIAYVILLAILASRIACVILLAILANEQGLSESSSDPPAAGAVPAHIAELARTKAEETSRPTRGASPGPVASTDDPTPEVLLTHDAVPAEGVVAMDASVPEVEVQPVGSSSTLVHAVDAEPVCDSMPPPPPPTKRETVLGLHAPSVALATVPKSRKRPSANSDAANKWRCTKDSQAGPFVSLIDGMINEYGSEVQRLAKDFAESRERSSQLEGKLKATFVQFESQISELELDLGKTASSLLKAKEAKVAKSLELHWLKRKVKSGEEFDGLHDRGGQGSRAY
ncbi:hypothetical protein N665_2993s0001 [Sinapis alba]|nr:hypothetical protein N665_2993s0001 [Sinapis alba]